MSEIPLQSRLEKSLDFTLKHLNNVSIGSARGNQGSDKSSLPGHKLDDTNLALLLENQRIEDAYLVKESESILNYCS